MDSRENILAQLPLCFVNSRLFGRFLVSLPYINSSGVTAQSDRAAEVVIDRAVVLADELDCRFLELRHEAPIEHPALTRTVNEKVHMRMELPGSAPELRTNLKAKVRNQVKKGESQGFSIAWGGQELLEEFYAVFSRNMRDLGTPVFGRKLFSAILDNFPDSAELCSVRDGLRPVASALLIHGEDSTEVPSASSLREENNRNPNMLMYYHLLARSIERGQRVFDFGRSTPNAPTFRFKKQWGAEPFPANWQYHVRQGDVGEMRPNNPKYKLMIRAWQCLPLWCANLLGPHIVRGIP
jgi:FemAB-related protein (PEP-CTERM system-associated)